jgi:hypothetical protein
MQKPIPAAPFLNGTIVALHGERNMREKCEFIPSSINSLE